MIQQQFNKYTFIALMVKTQILHSIRSEWNDSIVIDLLVKSFASLSLSIVSNTNAKSLNPPLCTNQVKIRDMSR